MMRVQKSGDVKDTGKDEEGRECVSVCKELREREYDMRLLFSWVVTRRHFRSPHSFIGEVGKRRGQEEAEAETRIWRSQLIGNSALQNALT